MLAGVAMACIAVSCSTTSRLEEGDVLYDGVKKVDIRLNPETLAVAEGVSDQIVEAVNVKPNNSLISPYVRHPFPVGLWVYNHWSDSTRGLKGWLYKLLVDEPVLISNVKPDNRVKMINTVLADNGYFDSRASYDLLYNKRNPKKAKILYNVDVRPAYTISSVGYLNDDSDIGRMIDSMARVSGYYRVGSRYSLDSLNAVRVEITNRLRNRGYYYFRPDYLEYLADSTMHKGKIALRMTYSQTVPRAALQSYTTGDITTTVYRNSRRRGMADTVDLGRKGILIKMMPVRLRKNLMPSNMTFRRGKLFMVRDMDRTQNKLSQLGIFSGIDIAVTPIDSLMPDQRTVDVDVTCTMDQPLEAKIEAQATSKSNSYIGPGIELGLQHKNVFGGAEMLNTEANINYEWQTGGKNGAKGNYNSYAFGVSTTLAFPRLLAPSWVDRSRRYQNWTKINLSAELMNRSSFFKMAKFALGFTWQWHASRYSTNEFTPFKLTYTKLLTTTERFDSTMSVNPAVALSFRDQFIPEMRYSYTYDRAFDADNTLTWNVQLVEAGNIFSGLWRLAGVKEDKKLFGTPFSQFVKGQTSVVYGHRLKNGHRIVARVLVGAAHAYGNSTQVPYMEQFYIGGANSVRAFAVRSIGPGGFHNDMKDKMSYYDQTGTFKMEMNLEYRFPIFSYLKGAAFVDAGNIWLLKDDENRPEGKLRMNKFFKQLALGTGVGLRLDMDMIVIRADLGVGLHAPYDTGKRGYYNLSSFKNSLAFHLAIGYPF